MTDSIGENRVRTASLLADDEVFICPLSFAQQRLWVLDRLEPNSTVYNIPIALRLHGRLDTAALEQALSEVVRRHEVLRASFELQDGSPAQIVHPATALTIPVRDLSQLSQAQREAEAKTLALADAQLPFDLTRPLLFRASLLKLGDAEHVFLFTIHHIIFDGWSGQILFRELWDAYSDFAHGRSPALPELSFQYSDYAAWQRQYLSGRRLQAELDYWSNQLQGAPTALDLATDYARPARQTFRGSKLSISLPSGLIERLRQVSQQEGATLFMTLLAAFNLLLARYTGQNDLVVGSPVTGRNQVELEKLIGLFVNAVALRTDLSDNPTFRQLLRRVRETTLNAYAHQDLPFEKLVEELKPDRDLSRNAIFQVMFAFQKKPSQRQNGSGLSSARFEGHDRPIAKFDLTVTATDLGQDLRLVFEYSTDLFKECRITRMQRHFQNLLESIVADPDCVISDLSLLGQEEQDQILLGWNDTAADYDKNVCVHQLFERKAAATPGETALLFEGSQITYQELNERANQVARYLRQRGVGRDVLVGLFVERSIDMVVGLLGILKAGGAYVPLDPTHPKDRLACILNDASPAVLISQRRLLSSLPEQQAEVILLDADWPSIGQEDTGNVGLTAGPNDLAYVLYTSGSTGKPKGVQVEHLSVVNLLSSMQKQPGLQPSDVIAAITTLSFDIAGLEIYLPLVCGARVVIVSCDEAGDGIALQRRLQQSRVTVMQATPATWRMLLDSGWQGDRNLKILCGGEAFPRELANQLLPRCKSLWNLYGPTETTIWSAAHPVTGGDETVVPIGQPIANTQIYVLDARLRPVPIGTCGQIFIGGAGLARGYWNRPDLTLERFIPNPITPQISTRLYQTGDLGRYLPDGTLLYMGRNDNQIKLRGYRIELGEIENILERHTCVQQAVVVLREFAGEQRLVAYVIPKSGENLSASMLRSQLELSLPAYMIPATFMILDRFPLTGNGKVDRLALPAPEKAQNPAALQPRDELESRLQQIWQELLGVPAVGINENFFELGGHSLLAVKLVSEIQKETAQEIPLAALFQHATIEQLANLLREGKHPVHSMVAVVQARGSKPPFFGVVVPGGNPLGYATLSRHLGKDQPFYEIQGPGPILLRPYMPNEFEALAAEYIRAMKTIQPHGPYYFGGMCEGARIAFDMARLLEREGEKVGMLGIFDTWVLENSQNRFLWKINYFSLRLRSFRKASRQQKWQQLRRWLNNRSRRSLPDRLWPKAYWPGKDFVPAKYSGKITIFKIPKQPFYYVNDQLLGWGTRTTGPVQVHLVQSRHGKLLREPYVRALAPTLSQALEAAQQDAEGLTSKPSDQVSAYFPLNPAGESTSAGALSPTGKVGMVATMARES